MRPFRRRRGPGGQRAAHACSPGLDGRQRQGCAGSPSHPAPRRGLRPEQPLRRRHPPAGHHRGHAGVHDRLPGGGLLRRGARAPRRRGGRAARLHAALLAQHPGRGCHARRPADHARGALPRDRNARRPDVRAVAIARPGPQHRRPQGPDRCLPGRRGGRGGHDPGPWRPHGRPLHGLCAGQRRSLRAQGHLLVEGWVGQGSHGWWRGDRRQHLRLCRGWRGHPRFCRDQRHPGLQLQRPHLSGARGGSLCIPDPGRRRYPAERGLPEAAEHPGSRGFDAGPGVARRGGGRQCGDQPASGRRALPGAGRARQRPGDHEQPDLR